MCTEDFDGVSESAKGPEAKRLAAYNAVRAHELVLNEAAAALERAVIPPLLTLNGGAAAAFLTLLGALGQGGNLEADLGQAGAAVSVWLVGLGLAAVGFVAAKNQQSKVNEAYRLMRELLEVEVLDATVAGVIAVDRKQTVSKREAKREQARKRSGFWGQVFTWLWLLSAACFVAGGAVALCAIV